MPTPVRNGYIFDGWYTSSNGGTKITSSTNITLAANQTLYAHWVKDKEDEEETAKLTITFDPMGGKQPFLSCGGDGMGHTESIPFSGEKR